MNAVIIRIFDYFRKRPVAGWLLFILLTGALICSVVTLHYKEDISDFLPLDSENQTALSVYQDVSGANNIYAVISSRDSLETDQDMLVAGVDALVSNIEASDSLGLIADIMTQIDMDRMMEVSDMVFSDIPLFMTDSDYERIDSLISDPEFIDRQIAADKEMLLFPSSNLITANISRDPLNLFSPVLGRLSNAGMSIAYETYDSYILSPDGTKAIAIITSSFGANESENNSRLVELLDNAAKAAEADNAELDIHIIGGPAIAVSNASRIKQDSILAICLAGILILALLIYVFRNIRNILLIVVSIGWGWLFAMGGIALFYDSVSVIVIGIASVILGIAVNYPLHLIDHLKDSEHPRSALREIISPLIIGNITTVGAFLCLVPLNAPALHDLGLFSSLLLVGTIFFVLVFLPHAVRTRRTGERKAREPRLITDIARLHPENQKWLVYSVLVLTLVFGYFSLRTEFDSDMRNINYMTESQRADFDYFAKIFSKSSDTETLYIVSSAQDWDKALSENESIDRSVDTLVGKGLAKRNNEVSGFLSSAASQSDRIKRWNAFVTKYSGSLLACLDRAAAREGFSPEAFDAFKEILNASYSIRDFKELKPLAETVFSGNISEDNESGRKSIVQTVEVKPVDMEKVKTELGRNSDFGGMFFDVKSMNGSIANTLSDDFNYIGIACGCIVFLFLWFSFGSLELAVVSFIPMAVSWIWILGIMGMLGIRFNIVNVILATFIFGQGDDYTIFMTEGLSYEYAYRKKLLASYKNCIVVSALIMFIGIGTLIFAKHPALRSLGEVTVVGMLSVVLMAYLFPPLAFNWLVKCGNKVRFRPITIGKILSTGFCTIVFFVQLLTAYCIGFAMFMVTKPTHRKQMWFHRFYSSVFRFDIKRMPGVKYRFENPKGEDFAKSSVIICNHQSILDSFCIMSVTPKGLLIANDHIRQNPLIRVMFRWCGFLSIEPGAQGIVEQIRPLVAEGYSIVVFPEGERPCAYLSDVKRFHKGAFYMAETLGLDIVPVYFGGVQQIMPKGSAIYNGGPMYIEIGERLPVAKLKAMGDVTAQAKAVRAMYKKHLAEIYRDIFTPEVLRPVVYDRYRYKGRDIERSADRTLRETVTGHLLPKPLPSDKEILLREERGQGEVALMLALMYPDKKVIVGVQSEEIRNLLAGCADGFVENVEIERLDPPVT